jgi:hypothetical protein
MDMFDFQLLLRKNLAILNENSEDNFTNYIFRVPQDIRHVDLEKLFTTQPQEDKNFSKQEIDSLRKLQREGKVPFELPSREKMFGDVAKTGEELPAELDQKFLVSDWLRRVLIPQVNPENKWEALTPFQPRKIETSVVEVEVDKLTELFDAYDGDPPEKQIKSLIQKTLQKVSKQEFVKEFQKAISLDLKGLEDYSELEGLPNTGPGWNYSEIVRIAKYLDVDPKTLYPGQETSSEDEEDEEAGEDDDGWGEESV